MSLTLIEKALWRVRNALFAPSTSGKLVDGPIVIAGLFSTASGLGKVARSTADALEQSGVTVHRIDLSETFGQAGLKTGYSPTPFPRDKRGTLILCVNGPETDRALLALRHFRPRRWRIIGLWVWETSHAPENWRRASRRLSEIWAPSRFAAAAIEHISEAPVRIAPHYVQAPKPVPCKSRRRRFGLPEDSFVCLAMADGRSSFHRKNPIGAIEAFQMAFPDEESVRLIVKLRGVDAYPEYLQALNKAINNDQRILVLKEDLTEEDLAALISSADIFISLHRSEGFGLPIAESMAAGKPVVATGWSGNTDFTEDAIMSVDYTITAVEDPTKRYPATENAVWAEPDLASAAKALRKLTASSKLRDELSTRAQQAIANHSSPNKLIQLLNSLPTPKTEL